MEAIVAHVYSDLHLHHGDLEYLRDRAILTLLNEFVDSVNNSVLKNLTGNSECTRVVILYARHLQIVQLTRSFIHLNI